MKINDLEEILKQRSFDFIQDDIKESLKELKSAAVANNDQEQAKFIWCLEQIFTVKNLFIESFKLMKKGDYEKAWHNLDRSDIELSFLRKHLDYSDNKYDLLFIENEIPKYQELFPYDFFFSRESIESDFTCSICGAKFGLRRNNCSHEVGEIYNGEMCCMELSNMVESLNS